MEPDPKEVRLRNIIVKGLEHLYEKLTDGQKSVINKFDALGYKLSPSALSKIKTGGEAGFGTLRQAAKYMQEILRLELDMVYELESHDFVDQHTPNWVAYVVPENSDKSENQSEFTIHENGRVSIQEKTKFIASASKDVLEIGVRLNSYTSYFISQSEKRSSKPI